MTTHTDDNLLFAMEREDRNQKFQCPNILWFYEHAHYPGAREWEGLQSSFWENGLGFSLFTILVLHLMRAFIQRKLFLYSSITCLPILSDNLRQVRVNILVIFSASFCRQRNPLQSDSRQH